MRARLSTGSSSGRRARTGAPQRHGELAPRRLVVLVEAVRRTAGTTHEQATAGHDLGATLGQQSRRELLKTRIGSSEPSTLTALVSRILLMRFTIAASTTAARTAKFQQMMLADAEHVEADLLGEHRLLDGSRVRPHGVAAAAGERVEATIRRRAPASSSIEQLQRRRSSPAALRRRAKVDGGGDFGDGLHHHQQRLALVDVLGGSGSTQRQLAHLWRRLLRLGRRSTTASASRTAPASSGARSPARTWRAA